MEWLDSSNSLFICKTFLFRVGLYRIEGKPIHDLRISLNGTYPIKSTPESVTQIQCGKIIYSPLVLITV